MQNTQIHTYRNTNITKFWLEKLKEHIYRVFIEGVSYPFLQQPYPVLIRISNFPFFQIGTPWLTYRIFKQTLNTLQFVNNKNT